MIYKLSLFLITLLVLSGCSSKMPDSYYAWKSFDTVINDKIVQVKLDSTKSIKLREIKHYTMSQKNYIDKDTIYSTKSDRYFYINPSVKIDMKDKTFQTKSPKYKTVIIFAGGSICEDANYPCSFKSLRLRGKVFVKGKRSAALSRALTLSTPLRIENEDSLRKKIANFLIDTKYKL